MAERKNVRDTKTGQYVPKREATRRPATTVTETDKTPKRTAPPKKK